MRRVFKWLHLWVGLVSGIIVVVVCLTGGLYAFKDELTAIGKPWRHVSAETRPALTPSRLLAAADREVKGIKATAITYGLKEEAVKVDYAQWNIGENTAIYLNPYTGSVTGVERQKADDFRFFDFLLKGHLRLWLPNPLGRQVVGYGVLMFLLTLITGLVLWYPKRWTRKSFKSHFTLHRPFKFRRLMFDLHSVVGFYVLLPLIVASFTGLLFALEWFSKSIYKVTSGNRELVEYVMPSTDTTQVKTLPHAIDRLYARLSKEEPQAVQFYYALPQEPSGVYRVSIVHEQGSYFKQDNRFFDQRSLTELQGEGFYTGKYDDKHGIDKWYRMNLDLHEGRVFGWFGRILMCLASIVGASLPITGFILYWKRKHPKHPARNEDLHRPKHPSTFPR
ncbi:MAG: PepSY domain-containing protein [Prevotella sp.]|nr:PepSY domain-containing protein [Prevotella sp.]